MTIRKKAIKREGKNNPYASFEILSTVDTVPVVHAHWTPEYTETGVVAFGYKEETVESLSCSNCGMKIDVSEGNFMYCPFCGAKMDEKEEEK